MFVAGGNLKAISPAWSAGMSSGLSTRLLWWDRCQNWAGLVCPSLCLRLTFQSFKGIQWFSVPSLHLAANLRPTCQRISAAGNGLEQRRYISVFLAYSRTKAWQEGACGIVLPHWQ